MSSDVSSASSSSSSDPESDPAEMLLHAQPAYGIPDIDIVETHDGSPHNIVSTLLRKFLMMLLFIWNLKILLKTVMNP